MKNLPRHTVNNPANDKDATHPERVMCDTPQEVDTEDKGIPGGHPAGIQKGHPGDITKGHPAGTQGHPEGIPKGHPAGIQKGHPSGHPAGIALEGHGRPSHSHPSVMKERFGMMSLSDPGLFTVKRLESRSSPTDSPSPSIRTEIHCFVFVESGETLVTIGAETYLFKANECAVIPAGQVFSVRYWHECTGYMGGFHTDFLSADCSGRSVLRTFPFLRKWGGHKVLFDAGQAPFIGNILRRLCGESEGEGSRDVLRTYLTALLVEIEQARAKAAGDEPDIDNKLCNDFVEYVFENPTADNSLDFHAGRLNVSQSHLTRTVKRLTGKSPLLWINEAVILEAKVLLAHTDLPVGDIASRLGHSDPSYFTRMFRKHVGLAPLAYRNGSKNPKIG